MDFKLKFFSGSNFSILINRHDLFMVRTASRYDEVCGVNTNLAFSEHSQELQAKSESANIKIFLWALEYAKGFNLTSIYKLNEYTIQAPSCFLSCF